MHKSLARRRVSSSSFELDALESRQHLASHLIADFLPLVNGNQWRYAGTQNGAPVTAVSTLSAGGTINGISTTKITTVLSPSGGGTPTTETGYYAHTGTGLRILKHTVDEPTLDTTELFGAGARLATITLNDGVTVHVMKSISGTNSDGRAWNGTLVGDTSVIGLENITVGAGSFEALRVSFVGSVTETGSTGWTGSGTIAQTLWFVRGIGIVRADYSNTISYSDGGEHAFRYNLGLTSASQLTGATSVAVRGRLVDVAYGDTSPTTVDGTNFAGVDLTNQTKTRVFTITNTTNQPITLAPGSQGFITLSGLNADQFVVVRQPAQTIQPGQTTPFSVRFDPTALGFQYAQVSFKTTQAGAAPFVFDIRGTGLLYGLLSVQGPQNQQLANGAAANSANGTAFGSTTAAGTRRIQRVFTISNTGPGALNLTNVNRVVISGPAASDFTVTLLPASTIDAGGNAVFKISFDPSTAGTRNAVVTIYSNDRYNTPFTFNISGVGV